MSDQKSLKEQNKELWEAVKQNNANLVGRLVGQKANVNYTDMDGWNGEVRCSFTLIIYIQVK